MLLCVPALAGSNGVGVSFIGGAFPLPHVPETRQVSFERMLLERDIGRSNRNVRTSSTRLITDEIKVADASTATKAYLDVILQGVQACQGIWRDDMDKERTRWLDELGDAARNHGSELVMTPRLFMAP